MSTEDVGEDWQAKLAAIIDVEGPGAEASVAAVRRLVFDRLCEGKGLECPVCRGPTNLYHRPMTGSVAEALMRIGFATSPGEYVHIPSLLGRDWNLLADVQKQVHSGLLVALRAERDDGSKRNGFYMMPDLGRAFILGRVMVPTRMILYQAQCLGFDDEVNDIWTVLPRAFSFAELMGWVRKRRKPPRGPRRRK